MSDLFTLETPEIKGRNKIVFYEAIQSLPDKAIVEITPFTQRLRDMGATLSESSTERYARWSREWFGIEFESLGKGKYLIRRT
jgi:hypothetical protein